MTTKKSSRKDAKSAERNRYYTGKECKHGHVSERWTHSGSCIECDRAQNRVTQAKRAENYRRLVNLERKLSASRAKG